MELVGGLHLRLFQRSPFVEFARLQLDASRPEHAHAALRALWRSHGHWEDQRIACSRATDADCHSCFVSDAAFVVQRCNETIQQGDLALAQGDPSAALEAYVRARETLKTPCRRAHPTTTALQTCRTRCYRKLLHIKAAYADMRDAAAVAKLHAIMKKLESCVARCDNPVERVKSSLELGVVSLQLLEAQAAVSSPPRAFMSYEETTRLLEDAHARGHPLGLSHVTKQLRRSLGSAYVAALERHEINEGRSSDYLAWASASLLANASVIEDADDAFTPDDRTSESLDASLEELSARLSLETTPLSSPRAMLDNLVATAQAQIQRLPPSWLIASVAVSATSELVLSRIAVRWGCSSRDRSHSRSLS